MYWYFFSWESQDGKSTGGNQCLPFGGEFDLEIAHDFLLKTHERVGIVTFVMPISQENAMGFDRFIKKVERLADPKRGLSVVKSTDGE